MSQKESQIKTNLSEAKLFTEIHHIGIVVRDVEKTVKYFVEKVGIPFSISTMEHSGSLHGEPMHYKAKIAHGQVGSVTLELLETLEGKTIFEEFLNKHGEGIHHLSILSNELLDVEIEKWQRRGINPLQIDRLSPGEGTAYMDVPGCMIELLCFKKRN
jgi:4-hydroxyphenylpyruvate dioxygenase-like putative hemolysin